MRPGRPESIWQPPRGRQGPRESALLLGGHQATASLGREVWEALGGHFPPLEFFKGSTVASSAGGDGRKKNKVPLSVPGPSGVRGGKLYSANLSKIGQQMHLTWLNPGCTHRIDSSLREKDKCVIQKSLLEHSRDQARETRAGTHGLALSLPLRTRGLPSGSGGRTSSAITLSTQQ